LDALKPGGVLAYVTCSPHAAETKSIVASVLRKAEGIERINTPAVLEHIASAALDLPEASHVQLWPHRHSTDAMFIQLLEKRVSGAGAR
jgi:16S rRNA (cytosine967-C5)-methyltransferase